MTDHLPPPPRALRARVVWIVATLLVALACSFALWDPLEIDERRHIRRLTLQSARSVQADLLADMQSRALALVRLANTWSAEESTASLDDTEWTLNSSLFLAHHPNDLALQWVDPTYRVRWENVRGGESADVLRRATEERLRTILERVSGRTDRDAVVSPAIRLTDGTEVGALIVPVTRSSAFDGFLVALFDVEAAIHTLLVDHRDLGYSVAVAEGNHVIYRTPGTSGEDEDEWAQDVSFKLPATEWHVRVWPNPEMLADMRSPLPELAMVLGGLLGFMLMVTLHFGRTARSTSRELQKAHNLLEERVRARTVDLQNLSARLLQLQDEERRRIARELHDSTAQILGAVAMKMDTAEKLACKHDDVRLVQVLRDGAEYVERITQEIRTVSYLLHPPMLDELGLEYVLPWYVEGFSERSGVKVSLDVSPDLGRLPRDVELTVFRIAQEALTNVHRHARSGTARIALVRRACSITLEISDDGPGLPADAVDGHVPLGVGLAGMRERVRQLGGELQIESGSTGTTVRAVLQLPQAAAESPPAIT